MKTTALIATIVGIFAIPAFAADNETQRLDAAGQVLQQAMNAGDKGIPSDLIEKAQCVVVIPSLKNAGFIFSGKYGRGFAACRKMSGGWTDPAAMRVEGGGFGFQAGAQETDVILLVMSQKGMNGLLSSKFTLGGEVSVAAGPVGRDVTAQTDATLHADILSWSRTKGIFGGASLQGGTLRPDDDANSDLYGQKESGRDILSGNVNKSIPTNSFSQALAQYGGEHGK